MDRDKIENPRDKNVRRGRDKSENLNDNNEIDTRGRDNIKISITRIINIIVKPEPISTLFIHQQEQ